jgi:hypothetical protein
VDVLFLNPSFPTEMQDFCRGLAEVGARVFAVGSGPLQAQPPKVQRAVSGWLQVPNLLDEDDVIRRVEAWVGGHRMDRVEACWEPLVLCAAKLRHLLGTPGMSYDTAVGFRDKQVMKERLAAAGLRVPHSARIRTVAEARAAAERIGFPLILKPIDGAGSADTYRVENAAELEAALGAMRHVREASCEEFVEGEEFTYDTVCVEGQPQYENVAQYLPRPLVARTVHDCSPIILTYRDLTNPRLADGVAFGRQVLRALGMRSGFTHMEWYRKADGEVVFGEIGSRPGGARLVDQMNVGSDVDLFREWARAVCWGHVEVPAEKRYCTAIVFKRARGQGIIQHAHNLDAFLHKFGRHVVIDEVLRPGSRRRNWKQTLLSDGFVVVRHEDMATTLRIAQTFAEEVTLHAQ